MGFHGFQLASEFRPVLAGCTGFFAGRIPFSFGFCHALGGSLGWAMNPYVKKKLRSTLVAASTDSRMLMTEPNNLAGYPALSTNALAGSAPGTTTSFVVAGTIIFGDWSQLLIASWTGVDILINPYETTAYAKGRVMVRAMKDVDVAVRHGEAFAFEDSVTT